MPITAERLEVDVAANTAKASRDLDQFQNKTKSLAGTAGKVAKGLGAAFSGAAIAGGIAKTIGMAKNFDLTMRQVGVQTGQTGADLKSMSDLAIKMGEDTAFSAADASQAMLELAKGGLSAAEQKAGALKTTMTLAAAGNLNMANAAEYVTQGMNTFGIAAGKADQVAVALAGGANSSTASVESLGMALSQVGPGATNAGMSIQETVAALAAFDNAGIKGSDAGTTLKTMLTSLVPTTSKAAVAMEKYGLDFVKTNGEFKSMTQVAGELKAGFKGVSAEQRTAAMAAIFGSDATRAATVLMKEGKKGVEGYIKATKNKETVEKLAATAMGGASGAANEFMGSVETLAIKIGTSLLPGFTKAAKGGTVLVNKIGGWGDEIKGAFDWAKGFAEGFLKPFQPILQPMAGWLKGASDGASGLGSALAPVGQFISEHGRAFGVAAGVITAVFVPALVAAGVAATVAKVKVVASFIAQSAASAKNAAMVGVHAIKVVAAWTMMAGRALIQAARMAASWVIAMGPVGWAIAAAVAVGVAIYKNWDKIVAATKRAWGAVAGAVSGAWNKIKGWVTGGASAVAGAVSGAWGRVKSATSSAWEAVSSKVKSAWNAVVSTVKNLGGKVISWHMALPQKILDALGNLGSLLKDAGVQIITGLWEGLKGKWEDVKGWFSDITASIPNLKGPRAKDRKLLIENGQAIIQGLKDGLNREWSDVKKLFTGMTKWIDNSAISDKVAKAMEKRIERVSERTKKLLDRSKKVAAQLAEATQKHADAVQEKADFRSSTFQGMNAQANVMNSGNTAAAIAASLQAQVGKVQQFAANLAALAGKGLSADAIAQVTAAGVDGGAQVAAALASASEAEIASINASFAAIGATANTTADTLSAQLFDAGIATAQGVVDGLTARADAIKGTLRTIAQSMLSEVQAIVRKAVQAEKAAAAAEKAKEEAAGAGAGTTPPGGGGGQGGPPRRGRGPRGGPAATGGGNNNGRVVNFNFNTHNPKDEPQSRTTNKALERAASLGLV